jgi:hypothetical protein
MEALSSCAIEGNALAIDLIRLKSTDPDKFVVMVKELFPTEAKDE